ncbi:MAG: hypothetical protein JWM08_1649 [Candidatus Angelobacter sp.]|nr:hypothetical protein [Candidatus Angelobacter sp.]
MSFQRIKIVLGAVAYVAAFHWSYVTVLITLYAYEGFKYRNRPEAVALSWILALIPALWLPIRLIRPSQLVYWLLYLLIIVPVSIVTIHSYPGDLPGGIRVVLTILAAFAALALIYKLPLRPVRHHRLQPGQSWRVLLCLGVAFYGIILLAFRPHLELPSLSDVYRVRSQYELAAGESGGLAPYAVDWQALVLNPMLIVLGLICRRKLPLLFGILGQLLIYSFTGFRMVLFSSIFLGFLLLLLRSRTGFGFRILLSWASAVLASAALYLWSRSLLLAGLVLERLTGLPGLLTGFYFAFFSSHPKMMLSHSIFRHFIHNPYSVEPPVLIGQVYFPSWGAYANANVWADAYANFGLAGVFSFTALLGLFFWFYDSITIESDFRFAALVLAVPAISLANGGLLTCLLTHGLGLACVLMYCFSNRLHEPESSAAAPSSRFGSWSGAYPYSTISRHLSRNK